MDISTYWQTIKKQSKELTGVEKINAGIFHGSGIGSSLEDYIKAVKAGDAKKIKKAAEKALTKTSKYLTTIHKKEVATGKKAMKPNELKSAKIVGDALDKIEAQLNDVVNGTALAGSFNEDGDMDAAKSHEPLDPKLKKAAEDHIVLRKQAEADAKKYLKKYKADAGPVPNYLKLAQKGAADAKATKKAGDTFNNMQAVSQAERAVFEIEKVIKAIADHYGKTILSGKSAFMKGRMDFGDKDKLPKWFRGDYMKRHNAAWKAAQVPMNEINKLRGQLDNALDAAKQFADAAENSSMQAVDPAKLIKKLQDIQVQADELRRSAGTNHERVTGAPRMISSLMQSSIDHAGKVKGLATREADTKKRIAQVVEAIKTMKTLKGRVQSIVSGVEERTVLDAGAEAMEPLDQMTDSLKNFQAEVKTVLAQLELANNRLSEAA